MLRVLEGVDDQTCLQYDVIVFRRTREEYNLRFRQLLERQHDAGITLKKDKFVLRKQSVILLGDVVSVNGVGADPVKLKAFTQRHSTAWRRQKMCQRLGRS